MDAFLWVDEARDGDWNMAIDEALAERASQQHELHLRFYQWAQPYLSLGYFQRSSDRLLDPKLASLPFTRRLSGGGAIVHDREWTYSLAVPTESTSKTAASDIYCEVHTAIRMTLIEAGYEIESAACATSVAAETETVSADPPFLCFMRRASADLVVGQAKVVGSAQRRLGQAILQHGSILVEASSFTPQLRGLKNLTAVPHGVELETIQLQLRSSIQKAVTQQLRCEADWQSPSKQDATWMQLISRASELRQSKYADENWKAKL